MKTYAIDLKIHTILVSAFLEIWSAESEWSTDRTQRKIQFLCVRNCRMVLLFVLLQMEFIK